MVKLTILYKRPADAPAFELNYNQNLALLERMPGIQRRQACTIIGGPGGQSPYYRILEFYFEDLTVLDAAMRSEQGQIAGRDLMKYAPDAELIFAEVYED